jgi:hypothetical protein
LPELVRIAVKQALGILDCGNIIFAHKSNRRSGDVVIRCDVANPIFGHVRPPSFCGNASAVPRQLADDVCPKLRSAFRRGLGDRFDRHSRDYRIDCNRPRFDIRLLGNWVGAIHVSPIHETCGRSTNQREAPRLVQVQGPRPERLYAPSGDFAEPAYAARTSHWAASMKRGAGLRVAPSALGIAGTTRQLDLRQAVPSRARFAGGNAYKSSSFGIGADSGHHETASRECRPRRAGAGRWRADRSPGWSRNPGRRRRAMACRRAGRRGPSATTACRAPKPTLMPELVRQNIFCAPIF